jgi:hypothetical protein
MPIDLACQCGRKLRAKDEHAGKRLKCPDCGAVIGIPVPALERPAVRAAPVPATLIDTGEPENVFKANPDHAPRRPFWKDPVVLVGATVPAAILAAFAFYFYREQARKALAESVAVAKAEADRLALAGEVVKAHDAYVRLLKYQGRVDDSDTQTAATLETVARSEAALRAKADAERARVAAEIRAEAERVRKREEYAAEVERLSALECSVSGRAWVQTKAGTLRPVPGMTIYFLRAKISRRQARPAIEALKDRFKLLWLVAEGMAAEPQREEAKKAEAREFGRGAKLASEKLEEFLKDGDDLNTLDIYATAREATNKARAAIIADPIFPKVVAETTVAKAETDIDGKYEAVALKGGHYVVWGVYTAAQSMIEWLAPLDLTKAGSQTFDLHNNKAAVILNDQKDDD